MTHSPTFLVRLSFVRYLYELGLAQRRQPEPLSAAAVLTLHDALELFLDLACETLDVKPPERFLEYWDRLDSKVEGGLGLREPLRRLNKARVSLKHHGAFPSQLDLAAAVEASGLFLSSVTPKVFGVAFEDVSLVALLPSEEVRADLARFSEHRAAARYLDATASLAIAFDRLLYDFEPDSSRPSAYSLVPMSGLSSSYALGLSRSGSVHERRRADYVEAVNSSFRSIEYALKLIALGVDYRRYARFRSLTPHAARSLAGTYHVDSPIRLADHLYSAEELDFCFDFVVQTGLALVSSHGLPPPR